MGYPLLLFGGKRPVDYSFLSGALPSGVTFARASAKQAFNASGILAEVAIDIPAFEYDPVTLALRGLLIEPQATNIAWPSVNPGWYELAGSGSSLVVTDSYAVSLDGAQNAQRLFFTNNANYVQARWGFNVSASTAYTFSIRLKTNDGTTRSLGLGLDGTSATTKILTVTPTWATFSITGATDAATTYIYAGMFVDGAASVVDVSDYGRQLEVGSVPTSLIQTTSTAATRAADALSLTIPSGVSALRYVFDNDTTQDVSVSAGAYTVPTDLNRPHIKRIISL